MDDFKEYASNLTDTFQSSEIATQLLEKLTQEGQSKYAALESVGTILGTRAAELGVSYLPKFQELTESAFRQGANKLQDLASEKLNDLAEKLKSGVQRLSQKSNVYRQGEAPEAGQELGTIVEPPTTEEATMQTTTIPDEPLTQDEALEQIANIPRVQMDDADLYPEGAGGVTE
jgi:hypothetical protein